jgi:ParB family chromosome partitioning protein
MSIDKKKLTKGLGKGIGALMPDVNFEKDSKGNLLAEDRTEKSFNSKILIDKITTNPYQPRIEFDELALDELIESIKEHGVIQPITVTKLSDGTFQLVSGERRLRASKKAGLKEIPAYVLERAISNEELLEIAIIENVIREDLNPIEIAEGYNRLIVELNLTQDQVAQKIGKNRASVANYLRILNLPDDIKKMMADRTISFGHAKALLGANTKLGTQEIVELALRIIDEELSVRDIERIVKDLSKSKEEKTNDKFELSKQDKAIVNDYEDKLRIKFGTDVNIKFKNASEGAMEIKFFSKEDLERLLEIIGEI